MEDHLIKSTFLEKLRPVSLVSATLEIEYATQLTYNRNLKQSKFGRYYYYRNFVGPLS